jgi:hypothetical protein
MFQLKKPAQAVGVLTSLFAAVAALMVLIFPSPHGALDYLIAGTFATAILLAVVYGLFVRGRRTNVRPARRIVRGSAPPS